MRHRHYGIRVVTLVVAIWLIARGDLEAEVKTDAELGSTRTSPIFVETAKCGLNALGMACLVDGQLVLLPGDESGHREVDSFEPDRQSADRAREGARRLFSRER